ncbi:MAG: DUF2269 domain-containing protein [Actinobacteria bacterium]|nr:DUF2269 domain-containing protein [Actinomycetota bacterium]
MSPRVRKVALTTHVVTSVGWLGAVAASLALAIATLTSDDPQTVRGAHIALELMAWSMLVPLSVASLLSGIVQSLGTKWGLLRHYWVVIKLLITLFATGVLLLYTRTLGDVANVAKATAPSGAELDPLLRSPSPVLHASVALLLLLGATMLAVFKPAGLTRYGHRHKLSQDAARTAPARSR